MKFLYLIMIMTFMFGCSEQTDVSKKALDKDEYDILYTIGVEVSQQVKVLGLTAAELQAVQSGFSDNILENQLQVDISQHRQKLQEWGSKRIEAAAMRYSKQGEEYVKKFLEDPSIKKTVSGALIKDISAGFSLSFYRGRLRWLNRLGMTVRDIEDGYRSDVTYKSHLQFHY